MATQHAQHAPARLITAKAASRQYGIAYGSLRDIVHRGELPVIRVGRAWYLERADIDQWIESRKERHA